MAEWVKAAETQLELHRWLTSEVGQRWHRGWISAEKRAEPKKGDMYDMLAHVEPMKLLTAEAIWVAPEMSDIVTAARDGFQPEAMTKEDFIVPTGFCYFAKPLLMQDRNRKHVSIGALSWCPVKFQHGKDPDEIDPSDVVSVSDDANMVMTQHSLRELNYEAQADKWGMCLAMYSSARADEDDYSHNHRAAMAAGEACELIPLHYTTVVFGDTFDDGDMYDDTGRYTGADQWWKTVQSTLRLMQQRITAHGDEALPRPTRRRMQREGMGQVSEVLVIRLRRPTVKHGEPSGSAREWTHRWLVDGHWRNQPYPSLGIHRQIWISPYVKGPEDKELIVKRRYFKWDR